MNMTETMLPDDETQVRYVNGVREVRTFLPFEPEAAGGIQIRREGVYLITGGLGGLGLIFARYLVRERGARVALLGRSDLDGVAEAKLEELGANALYVQGDVCSETDVDRCIAQVHRQFGPLQGVIHAAGLHHDAFIRDKQADEALEVIRPKTVGIAILDKVTASDPLEFFVAFSSIAGVTGNVGQCDYAFANAYLDAFVTERAALHARGERPGKSLSINWPLWKEGGMRLDPDLVALKSPGLLPIDTAEGLRIFEAALASGESQVTAILMDPTCGPPARPADAEAPSPAETMASPSGDAGIAPRPGRLDAIGLLTKRFSGLTKIPLDRIQPSGPLENYGIDSILVMSFTKLLEQDFGPLSKTLLFEYQTLEALAGYFEAHHAETLERMLGERKAPRRMPEAPVPETPPVAPPARPTDKVRELAREGATDAAPAAPPIDDAGEIAIVGLYGRFPKADSPALFWQNLLDGRDCIDEIPSERWDYRDYFDAKPSAVGKTYNRWGGFLTDVDKFDAAFFRIPPREAELMDPQERLFLETVWHTIEDAGYGKSGLRRRPVGVFVGVMYGQYQLLGLEHSRPGQLLSLSSSYASIANRVSYFFDWSGPSMAVDTMCSSSLTAIHLACESIRKRESEIAIAGGVNLALHPIKDVGLAQGGYASEDGRCKSFGAAGDGYVPGEGVGAVLLKPRAQAIADGDHIYAVIKASCINHGGKTNGYSVPNPNAQSDVIAGALQTAAVDARTISYVEAHGTGTPLGDPIEITGLGHAFQRASAGELPRQFCAIGSAKSNIGHLEAAAGVAGLTKVLLQMQHRQIAPSLHSTEINPYIPFEQTPFAVQREAGPWLAPDGAPRRAGVSSFGAGGSNAHLVVEEYIPAEARAGDAIPGPHLLVFSAANEDRLAAVVRRFQDWIGGLAESDRPDLADLAFTLQVGREGLPERMACVVSDWDELAERLSDFLAGKPDVAAMRGSARRDAGRAESLLSGDEGRQFLDALLRGRNLDKLASLWVSGVELDWKVLWADRRGRRLSLPVYPFTRVRHWLAPPWEDAPAVDPSAAQPSAPKLSSARLSPLLHWNESTLKEQRFGSRFDAAEPLIRDHQVDGRCMLPGAATIEIALQAIRLAAETDAVQLQAIAWLRPFASSDDGISIEIALHPKAVDKLAFQLRDAAGAVHVEGRAILAAADAELSLALEEIKDRCPRTMEPAALYRGFEDRGLVYGPAFQTVREIRAGEDEVWSLLQLPADRHRDAYHLHPALLDGAFQSLAMISGGGGLEVPFSVDRVTCIAPLPARCVAVGKRSGGAAGVLHRYDIEIVNLDGRVLALIEGVATRAYGSVPAQGELMLFRPLWRPAPMAASAEPVGGSVLLFDGKDELAEELEALGLDPVRVSAGADYSLGRGLAEIRPDRLEDYERLLAERDVGAVVQTSIDGCGGHNIAGLHLLTRAALKRGRPLRLLYLHRSGDPAGEAVGAYAKSLRLEQPRMRLKSVGVEGAIRAGTLLDEMRDESIEVRYDEGGERFVKSIVEVSSEATGAGSVIPRGGVLLVTGGLGGLARIFATYLVEEYDARVVLAGRSALNEDGAEALEPLGDRVEYLQADISRRDDATRVVAVAKERFGRLDAVLHTAGVLRDGLIWNKTAEDFAAVLRPKVAGVDALDEATRAEPLALFVVFSSTAGLFGNAGQADYACANAYLDAFAHRRERQRLAGSRQGRTLAINWPLWSEGGMRGDAERLSAIGLVPLDRASGWTLFQRALASAEAQVWPCRGDKAAVLGWLSRMEGVETAPAGAGDRRPPETGTGLTSEVVVDYLIRRFAELTKLPLADVLPDEPIENYGLDSIMVSTFSQMLEHDLGDLSKTILFEFPTLEALGGYLFSHHAAGFADYVARSGTAATDSEASPDAVVDTPPAARFLPPLNEPLLDQPTPEESPSDEPGSPPAAAAVDDPIAIIGVAGRYPMAGDLDEFWDNLSAGRDCIEEVPHERWDIDAIYDPKPMTPGKTRNRWGGFVKDMDKFDPVFFNIAPLEAQYMDPQERMFLQTVWHTLEDAGCAKTGLDDRKVGVFVGAMYGHYQLYGVEERLNGNPVSLSSNFSTIANRVSYFFNWHGPSMAVDSMCSSSLTTIHLACESLRRGECELAVAGGVNATVHPEKDLILSQSGFSASDGRCRAFGEGGDGYVPAEGVGAVLLKPLSRAVADGNRIDGVIRASALNHGGKTNGYTVPNSRSQGEVIAEALRQSGIDPSTITYIEAHGTGTALGDPIEIEGLQQAFSQSLARHGAGGEGQYCAVGSVKSNIGHCEAAAGIAGVTKVLLQMRHGRLVPSIHSEIGNARLKLDQTHFRVQRVLEPWVPLHIDGQDVPRRAGISSFGAGGANAHLILEEHIGPAAHHAGTGPEILVLSARTAEQLREMAENLGRYLAGEVARGSSPGRAMFLGDVAYTLQSGRDAFAQRLALVASDLNECARKLTAWSTADAHVEGIHSGTAKRLSAGRDAGRPPMDGDLDGWAAWWVAGGDVDWAGLRGGAPARVVSLPGYPFLRQRFWVPRPASVSAVEQGVVTPISRPRVMEQAPHADTAKPAMGFSLIFFSDNSQVSESNKYRVVLEAAATADECGFEAIWTPERHFHPFGGIYSSPSALMAGLATITKRIRLRAGSVVLPLQDPLRVAEEWAVVDNLSGGRVDLAFASGWNPNDFALAPENHERLREIWLERIPEVQRLWRGETIERLNGKGTKVDLRIYPQPLQKELPVWLTASRRVETFIDAGKNGYNVLTMLQGSTLEQLSEKIARYREARADAGFEPSAGKVTLMLHTLVDADPERARKLVREPFLDYIASSLDAHKTAIQGGDRFSREDLRKMAAFSYERYCREASLIGDPAGCMEMVRKCHAAGVSEIACLVDFGAAPADVLASLPALDALRVLAAGELRAAAPVAASDLPAAAPATTRTRPEGEPAPPVRIDCPEPRGRFFTPIWVQRDLETTQTEKRGTVLLIHSGEGPLNDALVEASRARSVQRMRLGRRSRQIDEGAWEADLGDPIAIEASMKQMARPDLILFTGSIGLSSAGDEAVRAEGVQQATVLACLRTMKALHALGWHEYAPVIRMVTAGTFEVDPGEPICPDGGGLFGLAGSLAKEMPQLDIACVDLSPLEIDDPARLCDLAEAVLAEPAQRSGETVALRGGERWQQRLHLTELPELESTAFRRGGVYLIVGGAGHVGQQLGDALARDCGARLVFTGRRPRDTEIDAQIERIRKAGGDALYVQARAEDLTEMRQAVDLAVRAFGPINGVIHSAMVIQHELTRTMDETEIRQVLDPKSKGSAVLLELTRALPLDFLLFMGSAQSFFCEARQTVYAAACCSSDAYARVARQRLPFPVRVVHWGFWEHSLDESMRRTLGAAGLGVVQPKDGLDAVELILQDGPAAVGYLSANDEALSRMGMNPSTKVVRLSGQGDDEELLDETLLSQILA